MKRRFHQLDVFTAQALRGNPLAVVHDAAGLSDETMAAFARWTNLSETTFLLPPTNADADYRVRIFTPDRELPFAGHPTLGTCHAWLAAGGQPRQAGRIVQECGVGLVTVRQRAERLAFAAPPRIRTGPLEPELLAQIRRTLQLGEGDVLRHEWVANGPKWCAVMLKSADHVLAVKPDWSAIGDVTVGVVGPHAAGHDAAFEVRAFIGGGNFEDPVTGSLNASLAQWLIGAGLAPDRYVAAQGTALGRAGRVHIEREDDTIWVGGDVAGCIEGEVTL